MNADTPYSVAAALMNEQFTLASDPHMANDTHTGGYG
ncbi:MAG: hypothetical protein ACI8RN_002840, partial [Glaciecola sp.]